MLQALHGFLIENREYSWMLELALCTGAWVLLRIGTLGKSKWYEPLLEFFILLAVMSVGFLLSVALVFPQYPVALLWGAVHGTISFLYLRRCSTYSRRTRHLLWLALLTSSLCIMSMGGLGSYLLGNLGGNTQLATLVRSATYLLIPLVALRLQHYSFDDYTEVPSSGLRMLGFGTFCAFLLDVVETGFGMADYRISGVLLVANFCMFFMTVSAIQSLHTMCREHSAIIELQTEKQRFLAEREMTQMAESKLEDLRCIRHDLKNQYSYMQILLDEERYDELKAYFANLSEHLPAQLNIIDCGNRTLNTVLNMELQKLKSDRITVEHQLVVPPVLPFPDEDICGVITNLLDNAAEECRRLLQNGRDSAHVRLEIYPHQSYLYIKCSNSTDRTELSRAKGGLRTTKEDEQMHGYGTRIVTKIAEKHNGCADYSLADGLFVAQVMLDMTEGGKA